MTDQYFVTLYAVTILNFLGLNLLYIFVIFSISEYKSLSPVDSSTKLPNKMSVVEVVLYRIASLLAGVGVGFDINSKYQNQR